ncbi:hypothetical protein [Amycolatopsis sp. cmx-8-4]|uniref:hypothetical protein n=1 Tax=Amycolatopsis sp. cmx-8-4 TaxID=2790947 RepID=UPI00397A4BE8
MYRYKLIGFFAAMAETIRESTLEGLNTAVHKGNDGGRPTVITADLLYTVLRRRATSESVEDIRPDQHTQREWRLMTRPLTANRLQQAPPPVPRPRGTGGGAVNRVFHVTGSY